MDLNQNTEEKSSSTNNQFVKRKTLYIVNFTPIRLLIFSISAVVLILFIFVLGFHLGGSKPVHANNNSEASMEALMHGIETTSDDMNSESSSADIPNDDILALNEFDNTSSSIIREGNTSADRYNEYTQNLSSELDAINDGIKERETKGMSPNSTYTPPQQMATIAPSSVNNNNNNNNNNNTRVPYSSSSSSDSIYFIQVAVGYDKESTYSARDTLKAKFPKTFIKEEKTDDGKMMYKLKVGRYDNREDAQKALAEIKKIPAYKDSYIYSDKKVS